MRHRKSGRKLGRNSSHRRAMFRNMATSLIEEERIQTTAAKAKELRSIVEKLITLGSRNAVSVVEQGGDDGERAKRSADRVAAVRQAGRYIMNRDALQKLFGEIAERYVGRPGGYTRVLRTGRRLGDNAEMAIIELLPEGYARSEKAAPAPVKAVVEAVAEEAVAEEAVAEEAVAEEAAAEEAAAEEAVAEEAVAEESSEEDKE
ncbi:MAG: 50S ribosomal protein L17 [Bradymonadia bacterium]